MQLQIVSVHDKTLEVFSTQQRSIVVFYEGRFGPLQLLKFCNPSSIISTLREMSS